MHTRESRYNLYPQVPIEIPLTFQKSASRKRADSAAGSPTTLFPELRVEVDPLNQHYCAESAHVDLPLNTA